MPRLPKPDAVAKLLADAHANIVAVDTTLDAMKDERAKLRPVNERAIPVPPSKPKPTELTGKALALDQMRRLKDQMGNRSKAAYERAVSQEKADLIIDIKLLIEHVEIATDHVEDVHYELGMCLHALKQDKPPGITWAAFLKDQQIPLGSRRADEYIRIFHGMTTALELKEKNATSKRKARAKRAGCPAQSTVDIAGKFQAGRKPSKTPAKDEQIMAGGRPATFGIEGSACDINWEHHRDDHNESDAVVRARAADYQLHECHRMAEEFALLRPGTQPREITSTIKKRIAKVISAWRKLQKEMNRRRR